MKQKDLYAAPETEVLELKLEANVLQVTSSGGNESLGEDTEIGW